MASMRRVAARRRVASGWTAGVAAAVMVAAGCGGSTPAHRAAGPPSAPTSGGTAAGGAGAGAGASGGSTGAGGVAGTPPSTGSAGAGAPAAPGGGTGPGSGSGSASGSASSPASGSGGPAAQAGLEQLVRAYGPHDAASPAGLPGGYAALAHASVPPSGPLAGVPTLVDIYRWDGSSWRPVATGLGSGASLDPVVGFTVTTAPLTGGSQPDFVVSGAAGASADGLFVVSEVSGRWEAVPVDHASGGVVFIDSRVAGTEVQESVDSCNPDCAEGRITTTSYRFSASTGRFEPTGTPTVSGPGQP